MLEDIGLTLRFVPFEVHCIRNNICMYELGDLPDALDDPGRRREPDERRRSRGAVRPRRRGVARRRPRLRQSRMLPLPAAGRAFGRARRVFRRSRHRRRGPADGGIARGRPRQQRQLRRGRDPRLDRAARPRSASPIPAPAPISPRRARRRSSSAAGCASGFCSAARSIGRPTTRRASTTPASR